MSDLLDVENPLGGKLACPYTLKIHLCLNRISLMKQ